MLALRTTLALALTLLSTFSSAAPINNGTAHLSKRDFSGRATYYAVGLGACGQTNVASDYIVALNSPQYGSGYPGPNCFKMITISANGKTAQAQIMDQCPGCPYGGLDMSQGLFEHFADTSVGVFQMTWSFNGEGDSQPTTTQQAAPTTTYTPPTSTYTPTSTTPTSTYTPPATTATTTTQQQQQQQATSASPTSAAAASPASASASASSASAAMSSLQASLSSIPLVASSAPAATATGGAGGEVGTISNLRTLSQVIVNLGSLVVVNAAGAK